MNLPEFLDETPEGEILLAGHRIGLFHVVYHYSEGCSAEMIACQYPTLPLALIHKVIAFYLDERCAVDTYVASCLSELSDQRAASDPQLDVTALRERLRHRQAVETSSPN